MTVLDLNEFVVYQFAYLGISDLIRSKQNSSGSPCSIPPHTHTHTHTHTYSLIHLSSCHHPPNSLGENSVHPGFISHPTANLSTVMEVKASKFSKLDPLLTTFLKPTCTTTTCLTLLPSPLNWFCSILTPARVRVTYRPHVSSILPLLNTSQWRTSQAVPWSRFCVSTARSPGSIPGQGTKIPQAT